MTFKLTIKKTPHEREWAARVTKDGQLCDGPYFTNDKADAQATGEIMLKRAKMREEAGNLPHDELVRHALVSIRNKEDCGECFTCMCRTLLHARGFTDAQIDPPEDDPAPPTTTCIEHGPGGVLRLSFQIKVF